jgi:hypothetical protein
LSNVAIGKILGVDEKTVRNDLSSENSDHEDNSEVSQPSAVAESVARAHAAVVAVLPIIGPRTRLEFHARALNLALEARRIGDGEAVRRAEELCCELAGMRPIPPRA